MTTLDRLFRKGTLSRFKDGRAFFYQPSATHDERKQFGQRAFGQLRVN